MRDKSLLVYAFAAETMTENELDTFKPTFSAMSNIVIKPSQISIEAELQASGIFRCREPLCLCTRRSRHRHVLVRVMTDAAT